MMGRSKLVGQRNVVEMGSARYPSVLESIPRPPERLYVVGNVGALVPGLAVIGARKATPYGLGCARRFARMAAEKGVNIVSGGARGCDSEAHRGALEAGGATVVFLGGGCDEVYPLEHFDLFQRIIDTGGAVVSEHPWNFAPLPYTFRERNRLIAGLSHAVLIVEAGLPSGTFSTADEALEAGREVLVVPGAITSANSRGSNRLLLQGALPVVDDESFEDALFRIGAALKWPAVRTVGDNAVDEDPIVAAVLAQPIAMDDLLKVAVAAYGERDARAELMQRLVEAEAKGLIARLANGTWAAVGDRS